MRCCAAETAMPYGPSSARQHLESRIRYLARRAVDAGCESIGNGLPVPSYRLTRVADHSERSLRCCFGASATDAKATAAATTTYADTAAVLPNSSKSTVAISGTGAEVMIPQSW